MIRAELRFKNAVFMKALDDSEYKSIAEFSRACGICYTNLVEYANLRWIPKKIEQQVKIGELLNCNLYDLFEQYEDVVRENMKRPRKYIREIPKDKMIEMSSNKLIEMEADCNLESELEKQSVEIVVKGAVKNLKQREQDVLNMFFGMNGHKEKSLNEIAEKLTITRERVRQIREKAIRRLRHRSRSAEMPIASGFADVDCMRRHEERIEEKAVRREEESRKRDFERLMKNYNLKNRSNNYDR